MMANERAKIIAWSNVTAHPETGKLGARAKLKVARGGWEAHYHLDSHGKNPARVADDLDAIEQHHDAWAARQTEACTAQGAEFTIGADLYRVVDFTIPPREMGQRFRVLVGVRRVEAGDRLVKVEGFPLVLWYDSISEIPPNASIIAEVRSRLEVRTAEREAHRDFTGRVERELEQRGRGRGGGG